MKIRLLTVALIPALGFLACSKAPEAPTAAAPAQGAAATPPAAGLRPSPAVGHEIAWQTGDVDAAFAKAKAENKPLFLYWGAVWCPPCNEVKATIFSRQDFIERSRNFIPVYVDGDAKGAQKLGARFNVSGYPTMVLFTPEGTEITRLPGEVEAGRYMQVLALGMNGARPVKETLAAALAPGGSAALRPEDWRMLAWYSWETDESQVLDAGKRPRSRSIASRRHAPPTSRRWPPGSRSSRWRPAAKAKDAKPVDDKAAVALLMPLLADPARTREHFDLVVDYADDIAGHVTLPEIGRPPRARRGLERRARAPRGRPASSRNSTA